MPVDGTIQLAYQDTAWFNDPLNAEIILKEGQHVYLSDGTDEFLSAYVVGDGVTELQDLPWKGLIIGVQSVTGTNVDNTDPLNPVVNPLGLIQIIDLNGDFFTDLATASAYVATFNVAGIISDESYNNGVYYFTVPQGSDFSNANYFLGNNASTRSAYLVDQNNLVSILGDYAFKNNLGNNVVSALSFGVEAFASATGVNIVTDSAPTFGDDAFNSFGGVVTFYGSIVNSSGNYFGQGATGKFIILGKGSPLSCDATLFMTGATSTILVDKYYYTNNAGDIDACLANAITEGCNVQFEGINSSGIKGGNIPSNTTTTLIDYIGDYHHITGTTTITSLGNAPAGYKKFLVFDGVLILTNSANIILPNSLNILTAVNDVAEVVSDGGGVWRLLRYQRHNDSWTTYSPTLTGWSVVPTGFTARYILNGKTCMISFNSTGSGTSNATSITMTLPFVAASIDMSAFPYALDNGTVCTAGGITTAGSNVINILKNGAASWTSSGSKRVFGIIIYQIQ